MSALPMLYERCKSTRGQQLGGCMHMCDQVTVHVTGHVEQDSLKEVSANSFLTVFDSLWQQCICICEIQASTTTASPCVPVLRSSLQ